MPIGKLEIENEIDGDHPRGAGTRSQRPEDQSLRWCELGAARVSIVLGSEEAHRAPLGTFSDVNFMV